jgi:PST family polysaccharide transporter
MDLKRKVVKGLKWSFADQFLSQFIFLIFSIFMARILSPSDFGVISSITIFTGFATLFIDMGFGTALVQKKDADNEHYSSVFWLNIFIGFFLYGLFFLTAPILSDFFNQPQITILIRVICLTFIVNSLTAVQTNLLSKELKFKQKIIINWISIVIGYLVGFYLAFNNYGVWAIVWMTIVTALVNLILYWLSTSWFPSFFFNINKIKELSNFGFSILGETSVNYWSRNFDNFIIARVLGSTELGLYTRAYSLMLLPLRNISSVITKVMFPAFSKKQDDIPSIKRYYLLIIKYIALLTFPAMIGLSLVSREFVLLFFGNNWKGMIPVLSILSLVGAIQSIFFLNGMIYNTLGRANIAFRISLLVNFVLIIAFLVGVNYGIVGMAWSYLIASLLLFFPIYNTAIQQLNITLFEVFCNLKGVVFATIAMAILLFGFNMYFDYSLLMSLLVKTMFGIIIYGASLLFFEKELLLNLINKLKSQI